MNQILSIVAFIALIQITCACYITNCPIGGKRSAEFNNRLVTHQVEKKKKRNSFRFCLSF